MRVLDTMASQHWFFETDQRSEWSCSQILGRIATLTAGIIEDWWSDNKDHRGIWHLNAQFDSLLVTGRVNLSVCVFTRTVAGSRFTAMLWKMPNLTYHDIPMFMLAIVLRPVYQFDSTNIQEFQRHQTSTINQTYWRYLCSAPMSIDSGAAKFWLGRTSTANGGSIHLGWVTAERGTASARM